MPEYRNKFGSPTHIDHTILGPTGEVKWKLRIKPSGLSWRPKGQQKFYGVSLSKFRKWITDRNTAAKRVAN